MIRSILDYIANQDFLSKGRYILYLSLLDKIVFLLFYLHAARILVPAEYGLIAAIFTLLNILNAIFDFGMPAYFQRAAASNHYINKELIAALQLKSLLFFIYLLIAVIYSGLNFGADFRTILFIGITCYLFGLSDLLMKIMYGRNLFKDAFGLAAAGRLTGVLLLALLFLLNAGLIYLLGTLLLMSILHTLFLIRYLKVKLSSFLSKIDLDALKKILKSSVPMALGALFVWSYNKLDILLIQQIMDLKSVALYSVAYSLYQMPQILSGMILAPLYSKLSAKYASGERYDWNSDLKEALQLLVISFASVLILIFFSDPIVIFLFGESYRESAALLSYLSISLIPLFLNNYTGVALNSSGREKMQMTGTFCGLLINIALNLILIKSLGLMGAVIAAISTEFAVLAVQLFYLWRKT